MTSPAEPDRQDVTETASKVQIAVCTYNEATNIAPMLGRLRKSLPTAQLVVVDDNSPDGTSRIAEEFAASDGNTTVVVRENERGLGGAIKRAMEMAVSSSADLFVNLDADLSHHPEQVPDLITAARENPDIGVVVGSRYVTGGKIEGWPLKRRLMSRMVNRFATLCLRLPVKDCSGSMRCYRVSDLAKTDFKTLTSDGYSFLEELLVDLNKRGVKMTEVPITFTEREHGNSKLTLKEAGRSIAHLVQLAFR